MNRILAGMSIVLGMALVLLCGRTAALAAKLSISPVLINLKHGSSSATVTITNADDGAVRMQIQGSTWSSSLDGHPVTQPTDDIVIFPELITIPGHSQRDIRIGTTVQNGPVEKDYRILFTQLPEQESTSHQRSGITFLTRFSVPLFLAAQSRSAGLLTVQRATIHPKSIEFDMVNTGSAHVNARQLLMTGYGAQGQIIISLSHPAWYVLPGEKVHYLATISSSAALQIVRLKIDVLADMKKQSFSISPLHSDM